MTRKEKRMVKAIDECIRIHSAKSPDVLIRFGPTNTCPLCIAAGNPTGWNWGCGDCALRVGLDYPSPSWVSPCVHATWEGIETNEEGVIYLCFVRAIISSGGL